MNRVILSLKNIDKTYGKEQVLHNISFDIEQGEICGLIGENGAGKTTLMRILLGLIQADKGEIESVSQHKICLLYTSLPCRLRSLLPNPPQCWSAL